MNKMKILMVGILLLVTGCTITRPSGEETFVETDRGQPDSVLSTKKLGTIPGRAILDYSPRSSEEPLKAGVTSEQKDDIEEKKETQETKEPDDTEVEEENEEDAIDPQEEIHMEGKSIEQLTPVKDYLIDYEKEGRWVREVLYKDGDRYNHRMKEAKIEDDLIQQARAYFHYMTEINDYLGGIEDFKDKELDVTLRYAYKYVDNPYYVFYFREYIPKTLLTTGNEGQLVLDEDGRLIHYLAFGRRNPNVLHYEPNYDEKTAEKLVWRRFNNKLHGYVDDYLLTDLYLKIPTEGDYRKMGKAFRPQWFGEFRNKDNSYIIPYPDYKK